MKRGNALVVTTRLPWPLDDGGRIAVWQTLWGATKAYETTLICLVPPAEATGPIPAPLAALGAEVIRVPHRPPHPIAAAVSGLVGPWPYTLARYRCEALATAIRAAVRDRRPDFALMTPLHAATHANALDGTPMVLREHNVEWAWMKRYASGLGPTPAGLYARGQAGRLRAAEAALCRRAALVLAIQDEEAEALRRLAPETRVETVPLGIDLSRFPPARPDDPPTVLLAASFSWAPNRDGAVRFMADGWPRLRSRFPRARLRIVGKGLSIPLAASWRRAGAEVVSPVPSMEEEFARASLLLVPLWVGGGGRVKIVEAMAAGLPTVATAIAAAGLSLRPGADYLQGDTPADLADQAAELLESPKRREELGLAGRALAGTRWSLEAASSLQNRYCAEVARGAS